MTVAPVTSNIRGMPSEFLLDESDGMKTLCAVNLYGVMMVPKEKLGKWITTLDARQMESICRALRFALECDCPS
jgi:mRNA-degrading endonuclease toxin of MazEF toxin-antitoxin module